MCMCLVGNAIASCMSHKPSVDLDVVSSENGSFARKQILLQKVKTRQGEVN